MNAVERSAGGPDGTLLVGSSGWCAKAIPRIKALQLSPRKSVSPLSVIEQDSSSCSVFIVAGAPPLLSRLHRALKSLRIIEYRYPSIHRQLSSHGRGNERHGSSRRKTTIIST